MTLRMAEWVDAEGRSHLRGLPEGVTDAEASRGIPLGPPSLEALGLPKEIEVRLHNQLFARGILTEYDARSKFPEVRSALMTALNVDAHRILAVYQGQGAIHAES